MPPTRLARPVVGVVIAMLGFVLSARLDLVAVAAAPPGCTNTFTVIPSTNPGNGGNDLLAVAAIDPTNVWAVGDQMVSTSSLVQTETLIEHWDGAAWSTVVGANTGANPAIPTTLGTLSGVNGSSASDVWAVGGAGLIEHWNGSAWSVVAAATSTGSLQAVWAHSPTDAWAVGTQTSGSTTQGLTEHWNGSIWQVVPGQDSVAPTGWTAVSGSSATDVWAYGVNSQALEAEHWDGSSWTLAAPNNHPTGPGGVSAGGIGDVGAGGVYISSGQQAILGNSPGGALFARWTGSAWTGIGFFGSPAVVSSTMTATSAVAAGDVWFAGSANRQDPAQGNGTELPAEPFAAHFDGNQVTEVSSANPTTRGQYNGIAAIPGEAWAVGHSVDASTNQDSTLIETSCPTSPTAGLPEAPSSTLLGVAGVTSSACAYLLLHRRNRRASRARL